MCAKTVAVAVAALATLAVATPTPTRQSPIDKVSAAKRQSTGVTYNWSGVGVNSPSGQNITGVIGSYTLPACSDPNDGTNGPWVVASWVGFDGNNGAPSLVQAGSTCQADTNGTLEYGAWWAWLPVGLTPIPEVPLVEGDFFTIAIGILDPSSAELVMQVNEDLTYTTTLSVPTPTSTILGVSAEWIVEDLDVGSTYFESLCDYGTYSWENALYSTNEESNVAALDGSYTVFQLSLDDGSPEDGEQVSYYTPGSSNTTFSISYSNPN